MSRLEQEVVEKFHQLDKGAQQRVRALIERETESQAMQEFEHAAWLRDVEALREQIRAEHGGVLPSVDVVGMLREIRDGEDE